MTPSVTNYICFALSEEIPLILKKTGKGTAKTEYLHS